MKAFERLAHGLRLAEKAHADFEKAYPNTKIEWPSFYATWLLDNIDVWANDEDIHD